MSKVGAFVFVIVIAALFCLYLIPAMARMDPATGISKPAWESKPRSYNGGGGSSSSSYSGSGEAAYGAFVWSRGGNYYGIHSNLGDLDIDDQEGLAHALQRHGSIAADIMHAANSGQCRYYLQCPGWSQVSDGMKGYMVCPLPGGQVGIVPFYVDGMMNRLVVMTAFPERKGYEQWVTRRDGCVPVDVVFGLIDKLVEDQEVEDAQ